MTTCHHDDTSPQHHNNRPGFQCMTNPRLRSRDIIVEKTSVFDSSMRPMKLTFSNHDMTCR